MTTCSCLVPDLTVCPAGACCSTSNDFDPAIAAIASTIAVDLLWAYTGRRFTTCKDVTVRPCKPDTCKDLSVSDLIYWEARRSETGGPIGNMGVMSFFPTLTSGVVQNISCGCPVKCCTCKADCEVRLPGPVCQIKDVTIDGISRGSALWYVLDNRTLVFKHGTTVIVPIDTVPLPPQFIEQFGNTLTPEVSPFDGKGGVELTDVGSPYNICGSGGVGDARPDGMWDFEVPPGGGTFTITQPPNGHWTAVTIPGGGEPALTKVGNVLTVGFATRPNEPIRFRIRAEADYLASCIGITQTAGQPVVLQQIQWSDNKTTECGVRRWVEEVAEHSDHSKEVCCNFPTSSYTDVGNGGLHCFDQPPAGVCNIPAGTWKVSAGGNTAPFAGTMLVQFSDGQKLFEQAGSFNCGDFGEVVPPIANSGTFTFATPVTATLFFEADNGDLTPHPITNPFVCYEPIIPAVPAHYEVVSDACCPPCQDYNKSLQDSDPTGTWSVTYTYGEPWPAGAAQIAGLLACDVARALSGDTTGLPADVVNLARQGISIELPNPFDLAKARLTGIKLVDRWIIKYNPFGLTQRSRVWSPDLPIVRRES